MIARVLAPAKVTLSLRVTGVRSDGYHEIDAEMATVSLADELTFGDGDGLEVVDECGGALPVPADGTNLVARALEAVGRTAYVRLVKRIPAGGGLGGGSADAAAVLRWASCSDVAVAASLGADVPFCLVGGRARVGGIGEVIEPLPDEERILTLLTPPGLACPTPAIYRAWDAMGGPTAEGANDLEPAALHAVPELARWRDLLGDATGETPVLAGSGSTWFVPGDFPDIPGAVVVTTVPAGWTS